MFEYDINCIYDGPPDPLLAHKVLYLLVSRGSSYNTGKFSGSYMITAPDTSEEYQQHEDKKKGELLEKLPEIVDAYAEGGSVNKKILSIWLADICDNPIDYGISFIPASSTRTTIKIKAGEKTAGTSEKFGRIVEYVKLLCNQLDILYAAYESEHAPSTPSDPESILAAELERVTYYGPELVDELGRDRLRSTPAYEIDEFDDGGIFLRICAEPFGWCDRLKRARTHLAESGSSPG